jgi:predicted kinase
MTSPTGPRTTVGRRARLILVCGPGGSGKTTLADLLSQELRVACLHKDDVKASLHDAGITTPHSFAVLVALTERLLVNGVDLIIEATLHVPADWAILRRWEEAHDLELVAVICSADRDERERRIRTRVRHPAHAEADRRQLAELDVVADYALLPGRHIDVSTHDGPSATLRSVLQRLAEPTTTA